MKNSLRFWIYQFFVLGVLSMVFNSCENNTDDNNPSTVTDIDGNLYHTVKIGTQTWTVENLKTSKLNDNTDIPLVTENTTWTNANSPAYCWYNNDSATYANPYGALYNWHTVSTNKLCPTGWHVPSDDEWKTLEIFLGMSQEEADLIGWRGSDVSPKLKETDTTHWHSPNTGATNATGFTALPGGSRFGSNGYCNNLGFLGNYWCSSEYSSNEAWFRVIGYKTTGIHRNYYDKDDGFSVRCVKD